MRELNEFNKLFMQKFTSKQAYTQIKGHYMPIKMEDPTDESVKDIEKRKYYIQNYKITLMGFLLDEAEFQVSPGITRNVTMFEVDALNKRRRTQIIPPRPDNFDLDLLFITGNTQLIEVFRYSADIVVESSTNVSSYDVTINNNYVGSDLDKIQINDGDTLLISVNKTDNTQEALIKTVSYLVT
jgi:hypothetical protein